MKFMVTRTSESWSESPPCEGAVNESYTRIDDRVVNSPTKIPKNEGSDGKWWYEEGTNHRVERGHIKRDFPDTAWFIEIPDLPALLKFEKRYGELVIRRAWSNPGILCIEIYDGWRE